MTQEECEEYCIGHEIDSILDHIKEEFFDNRIRAYKLTKMGLIQLFPFIKDDMKLEFLQHIKNESMVIELQELIMTTTEINTAIELNKNI